MRGARSMKNSAYEVLLDHKFALAHSRQCIGRVQIIARRTISEGYLGVLNQICLFMIVH